MISPARAALSGATGPCTLLPGAALSACPGYRFTAICHPVARTDAQHRLREICRAVLCSRGRRKAPARATGSPPSASRSRDRCAASPPGNYAALHFAPGGGARRLPGLQVHRRLPARSRDRCAASPPGDYAALHFAPGGGARRLPRGRRQAPARATGSPPSAIP